MLVRHIRQENGLSLRALAAMAGMSYPYLCNVENGKADPSLSTLRKLAKALGVTVIDLLADEDLRPLKIQAVGNTQQRASKKKGR